jgi:hypothetical protein
MPKYRSGKLHSGSKHGKVVKNPKQAKAILLSELRSEGRIPERKGKRKTAARKRG